MMISATIGNSIETLERAGFRLLAIIFDGELVTYRAETGEGRRYVFPASRDEVVCVSEGRREPV